MAVKGHKERALLRRGYHVQEALKRRSVINEFASLRRNLITENEDINFLELCQIDTKRGITDSVYCGISNLLDSLPSDLAEETYRAILSLYYFFRQSISVDNRRLFRQTCKAVLKNENPNNAFILISKFLVDNTFEGDEKEKADKVKTALYSFREKEGIIPQSELEDFLKQARFMEYSKYEESFKSDNFKLVRGRSKVSHGQIDTSTGSEKTFFNLVNEVYEGKADFDTLVNSICTSIRKTNFKDLLFKADLVVEKDLKVGDDVIIRKGSKLEVKKLDYEMDSYFSEYFSMYKNSNIPEIAKRQDFKDLYNRIIDTIFIYLVKNAKFMVKKVRKDIEGIIYDKNLIVLKKDIDFYWSNKGQRGCDERRLSIRFRINKEEITGYIYDNNSHSDQLTPIEIAVDAKPRSIC